MKKRFLTLIVLSTLCSDTFAQGWVGNSATNSLYGINNALGLSPLSIGIGTNNPSTQFHTTGGVRFQGIAHDDNVTQLLGTDGNGDVRWRAANTLLNGAWLIGGNGNINSVLDFLGTTNPQPVYFRSNNIEQMRINPANAVNVGVVDIGQPTISNGNGNLSIFGRDIVGFSFPQLIQTNVAGLAWLPTASTTVPLNLNTQGRHVRYQQINGTAQINGTPAPNLFYDLGIGQRGEFFLTGPTTPPPPGTPTPLQQKTFVIDVNNNVGINLGQIPVVTANFHTRGTVRHEGLTVNTGDMLVIDANGNVFDSDIPATGGIQNACANTAMIPRVINANGDLDCSQIFDNGTSVGVGTTTPAATTMATVRGNSTKTIGVTVDMDNINATGAITGFNSTVRNNQQNTGGNFRAEHNSTTSTTVTSTAVYGSANGSGTTFGGEFYTNPSLTNIWSSAVHAEANDAANATTGINAGVNAVGRSNTRNQNYGVKALASTPASGSVNSNYGVYAEGNALNNTSTVNYGVYAKIIGGANPGSYAGYFTGDVPNPSTPPGGTVNAAFFNGVAITSAPGTFVISDQKFKDDINEYSEGLETILKISPKTYTMKGKDEFPTFNFSKGKQYGFIAQEIEKIIPEMVYEAVNPALHDKDGKKIGDAVSFKAVNYTALIPVLVSAIQDQQKMIDNQQTMMEAKDSKINELEERIKRLENGNSTTTIGNTGNTNNTTIDAMLFQNVPNPFNGSTEIRYRLAQNYSNAEIMIFDMNGKKIKHLQLHDKEGQVTVSATELSAGMYMYSLVLDGQEVATKRMIVN